MTIDNQIGSDIKSIYVEVLSVNAASERGQTHTFDATRETNPLSFAVTQGQLDKFRVVASGLSCTDCGEGADASQLVARAMAEGNFTERAPIRLTLSERIGGGEPLCVMNTGKISMCRLQ